MTAARPLVLRLQRERFAVCRLERDAPIPAWAFAHDASLWSLTRAGDELSVVAEEAGVPPSVARVEGGWRALSVPGPIPFEATGVVASLTVPLAAARVPVFVISTFDTDHLLVKDADLPAARAALLSVGIRVEDMASS